MRVSEATVYLALVAASALAIPAVDDVPDSEPCSTDFKSSLYVRPENNKYDPSMGTVGYPGQSACNGTYVFHFDTTGWPKPFAVSGEIQVPGAHLKKKASTWNNKKTWKTKIELTPDIPLDDFTISAWFTKSPGGYTGTLVNWVLKRISVPEPVEPEPTETAEPTATPSEGPEPTKMPKHPKHPAKPKHPRKGKMTPTPKFGDIAEPTMTLEPTAEPEPELSHSSDRSFLPEPAPMPVPRPDNGKYGQKVMKVLLAEQF
ncbi:hypothetical protein SeMB42_g07533 [Synchytrium endobioticum]|nr:hypothetical protein SeMB42_g07533 [Synchytrium endobioticum]TPX39351.1 hypothetical protein SeLEV6574_g07280 [Synchytrium endobioticum]